MQAPRFHQGTRAADEELDQVVGKAGKGDREKKVERGPGPGLGRQAQASRKTVASDRRERNARRREDHQIARRAAEPGYPLGNPIDPRIDPTRAAANGRSTNSTASRTAAT